MNQPHTVHLLANAVHDDRRRASRQPSAWSEASAAQIRPPWLPSVIVLMLMLGLGVGVLFLLTTLPIHVTLHQIRIVAALGLGLVGLVTFIWAEDEEDEVESEEGRVEGHFQR